MASMVPEAARTEGKLQFDVYEADPRSGELRKHGTRIPLEERPFRALLILLRQANELVTREELQKELWSSDTFVDFDHGLNTAIRKIRLALNDRASAPRFIETVGRRGYRFLAVVEQGPGVAPERAVAESPGTVPAAAPQEAQKVSVEPASRESRKTYFGPRVVILAIAACAIIILLLAYLYRPAMPLPRVTRVVQLTKSGGAERREPLYTDGPRLYYQSTGPLAADWQLRQVLLNGNEDTPVDIPAGRFRIRGLSPDDTEFLALSHDEQSTVWTIPVASGSPQRIGNLVANDIAWSHDGGWFAYAQGNQLFLARSDGTSSRLLATVPDASGTIDHVRWAPDDRQLRFTLNGLIFERGTQAIWEVSADGRNLRELRFWPGDQMECCGEWTRDGRYFVFSSRREGISNLWALEEKSDWWRRANRDPVQLTSGPVNYYQPIPSRDGRSIFAIGVQPSGELDRYDPGRKDFVSFLGGQSVDSVEFSRDRQWMTYVDYPEGTLWRARSDGTERLQLTFPPLRVGLPRWSPNGKRIAFHAACPGCLYKIFVISADGGNPEPLPSQPFTQACPEWMPAGDAIIYSRSYGAEHPEFYRFDLRSGRIEKIPGSDGLFDPRWSPDGRYLLSVEAATDKLLLVDLKSGRRTQIAGAVARWPTWSADSQYIYFTRDGIKWILRVHVPDGKEEKVVQVPFRTIFWPYGMAPDGSLIMVREHGRYEAYALKLSLP
jgi:Tol biopolymer transport system component/DNA-binding winged helix-turn-helix (wHTH) protein